MKQKIILILIKWLIGYLDGYHLQRNRKKKAVQSTETTVTMNTEGEII